MQLLEREAELAELAGAIDVAAAGGGRFVAIEGSAGIGKTQLLAAAREHATAAGLRVLSARGSELERAFAYGVVRQLLEPVVARAEAADRAWLLSGAAAHAEPVLTRAGAAGAGTSADAAFALLHGLYWVTVNLAERRPLLIVVDDAHWSDEASLRWLAYVANRLEGLPVAVVAATRPAGADADAALADVLADQATVVIRPRPLSKAAAARLASARLEHAAVERIGDAAHEATGGNPLLLGELLTALAREQLPAGAAEALQQATALAPRVVSRRVALELAKLGPAAGRFARAVAVLGDGADAATAAALAGLDGAESDKVARALAQAEILLASWPLRFVHPLVRAAVAEAMAPAERAQAHARAAQLLAEHGASRERIAAQLLRAPRSGSPEVVDTLRRAADEALARGAADGAVTYLLRALEEPPPAAEHADVLLALSAAEARLGAPGAVEHLQEGVRLLDDAPRRTRARLDLARALFWRSRETESVAEIERALAEAPGIEGGLRRMLEAERLSAQLRIPGMHERAFESLDGLRVDEAEDAGARMLLALKAYGLATRGISREEAVALGERALARGLPTDEAPGWAAWGAVSALLLADALDTALSVTGEAVAAARQRGAVYSFSGASMVRASLLRANGSLLDAEADARAAVEALPHRNAMITPLAHGELAAVLLERGLVAEAAQALERAGADGPLPESIGVLHLLRARSALRLAQGDAEGAAADGLACGRALAAVGFENPAGTHWRSAAALAQLALGRRREARRLARAEVELARRWGAPRAVCRALRALGLTQDRETGIQTLREALAALDGSPALLERARTLVELGAALRRDHRRVDAREALREGLDLAQRCGAVELAERAREELVAAGAKPRSTALSGRDALTPSERRVAGMAAEGMSNREIAQALFVTPRTVEMHLSNGFRKLDIRSRTQLVEALGEPSRRGAYADRRS